MKLKYKDIWYEYAHAIERHNKLEAQFVVSLVMTPINKGEASIEFHRKVTTNSHLFDEYHGTDNKNTKNDLILNFFNIWNQ